MFTHYYYCMSLMFDNVNFIDFKYHLFYKSPITNHHGDIKIQTHYLVKIRSLHIIVIQCAYLMLYY